MPQEDTDSIFQGDTSQANTGISQDLNIEASYTPLGMTNPIKGRNQGKNIYLIDRFDGGLNLNKAPRDLEYWEACKIDELSPSKIGRLVRLGDFNTSTTYTNLHLDGINIIENYGLHYFKFSDSIESTYLFQGGSLTNYILHFSGGSQSAGVFRIWNLSASGNNICSVLGTSFDKDVKPVFHSILNRVYVSDASFKSNNSYMFGIIDRPNHFPIHGGTTYEVTGNTGNAFIKNQKIYQTQPTAGITGKGNICVSGHSDGYENNSAVPQGIYLNVAFANDDIASGAGWGAADNSAIKYYKIYASYLYDDGSETKLSDVTSTDNSTFATNQILTATTGSNGENQKLVIKQVFIDADSFISTDNLKRIHGARFYYEEVDSSGNSVGTDKYQWAELDFRYGFKLVSEFGTWHKFYSSSTGTSAIQVENAAETSTNTTPDGTLSISDPPVTHTYYTLNLFHEEELKDDLLWKSSTTGNGIAFIGNLKYDGREYPDTMLFSGAGESDAGSAYPMWGTFPVDSNRIDMPDTYGEITALKWVKGRVLQFRKNVLYIINVEDVLSPKVEAVKQGMGVEGQYAVAECYSGIAWLNSTGVYLYDTNKMQVRSLTLGRIDFEDFNADSNSKIGYDDRAKMLILTNYSQSGATGYHYAFNFITDAWCTWDANKANAANAHTNFAVDHNGYLTSAKASSANLLVYRWNTTPTGTATIEYITKDIDFGKPSLDKRLYTIYISYIGGTSNEVDVYIRANGMKGSELTDGWTKLQTIQDYTDPYGNSGGTAWASSSGSPTTGDAVVNTDDGLDSTDQVASTGKYEQKLAKINLRSIVSSSGGLDDTVGNWGSDADRTALPKDYFKFARSIQLRFQGTASTTFEINDISIIYKDKRVK